MREQLKAPMGQLVPDALVKRELLERYFSLERITVSVGDRTTERLLGFGLVPFLQIVDSHEKRIQRSSPAWPGRGDHVLKASNSAGSISFDALQILGRCLELRKLGHKNLRLEIDGEEDLLALPVVAFFPEQTITFYGQPDEGMVIVSTRESRKRAMQLLRTIGISSLG